MNLKAAIFDLDGTLLDSTSVWDGVGERLLAKKGLTAPENLDEMLKNSSVYQAAELTKEMFGLPETVEEIIEEIKEVGGDGYRYTVPLKPGVEAYLKNLASRGVRMCVATASDETLAAAALERLGVLSYFEFILTCTEVRAGKDSPAIYRTALERLESTREEALVFEDSLHSAQTAAADGFRVVGLYDVKSEADTEKLKEISFAYFYSLEDCAL